MADKRVGHDLEGERREGLLVRGMPHDRLVGAHLDALDRRDVGRRRQVIDDSVEQRLDAFVLEGRAAQYRDKSRGDRALADAALQRFDIGLLAAEIGFERGIVLLDRQFDKLVMRGLRGSLQFSRDLDDVELRAQALVAPFNRIHCDDIDDADKIAFGADRQLGDQGNSAEAVLDLLDAAREVGADPVHLVYKADARHAVFVRLAPHRFGLRLDAGDRVEYRDRAIEHAQAAFDLDREIDMAGRVDDVDAVVVPEAGRRGRGDRDAAFLLLLHPIHRRGAFMHLAELVGAPSIIKDPLGGCRLTGIDVRHDADIAIPLERRCACHHQILRRRSAPR